jgi:hypothetical protein
LDEDDDRLTGHQTTSKKVQETYVRFYPELAVLYGVRFSALIHYFASWIVPKIERGEQAVTWDPCHTFADHLGIDTVQARRLVRQAERLGIISAQHIHNATLIRFKDKRWINPDRMLMLPYYDRDLADKFGLNGAILLAKIASFTLRPSDDRPEDEWTPGLRASPEWFVKRMPWMNPDKVRCTLNKLRATGAVDWDTDGCHFGSKRYYAVDLLAPLTRDESSTDTVRRTYGLGLAAYRDAGTIPSKKRSVAVKPKFKRKRIPALVTDEEDEASLGPAYAAYARTVRIERLHTTAMPEEASPASLSRRAAAAVKVPFQESTLQATGRDQ